MKILKSIKRNDLQNLALLFSLKAVFVIFLCAFLGYKFGALNSEILAIIGATGIYFLPINCIRKNAFFVFLAYFLACLALIFCLNFIQKAGFWVFVVLILWFFLACLSVLINPNFARALKQATFIAILVSVFSATFDNDTQNSIISFAIGSGIALAFRFVSFSPCGRFSKKIFGELIADLSQLALNLDSYNFNILQEKFAQKLQNLKQLFSTPSINANDQFTIKNQSIALFYLHKYEEIFELLISLKIYFQDGDFKPIQNEISKNIKLLKNLLSNKKIVFTLNAYKILKKTKNSPFLLSLLDVLYNKLDIILKCAKNEIKLEFCSVSPWLRFKNAIKTKSSIIYSLKFTLIGVICVVLSFSFGLNIGLYFALGGIVVLEISLNYKKSKATSCFFGALLGAILGNTCAFFCQNFVFGSDLISQSIFVVVVFLILYLKIFNPMLWLGGFVAFFSFSLATLNETNAQIALQCGILVGIILWQKDTKNLFNDKLNLILDNLCDITNSLLEPNLSELKSDFALNLQNYKNCIKHQKFGAYNGIIGDLQILYSMIMDLENFIRKNSFDTAFLKNDLEIISRRFTMIKNINLDLPVYFHTENRFMIKDDKLLWIMNKITQIQSNLSQKLI